MHYPRSPGELPREVLSNDVFMGLRAIIDLQEYIMAAIDDLNAAVSGAVAAINAAVTTITQLQQQIADQAGAPTSDQLEGLAAQLNAATSSLTTAHGATVAAAAAAPVDPAPAATDAPAAS